jgi:hypothetical protein
MAEQTTLTVRTPLFAKVTIPKRIENQWFVANAADVVPSIVLESKEGDAKCIMHLLWELEPVKLYSGSSGDRTLYGSGWSVNCVCEFYDAFTGRRLGAFSWRGGAPPEKTFQVGITYGAPPSPRLEVVTRDTGAGTLVLRSASGMSALSVGGRRQYQYCAKCAEKTFHSDAFSVYAKRFAILAGLVGALFLVGGVGPPFESGFVVAGVMLVSSAMLAAACASFGPPRLWACDNCSGLFRRDD